mmetsp:Transcript_14894/g.60732  ORF Transcript_14894/g.60732 Transcript_14894/m.60732 type:complete len:150 (+) Transcript_14894:111-560(+)
MNSVQAGTFVNVGQIPSGGLGGAAGGAEARGADGVHGGAGMQGGYVNTAGIGGVGVMHPSHVTMMPQYYTPPAADDQPVYVNAKQYHRILKRREARKRKYGDEDVHASRNRRKQYIHESRHRHAMNRQRGAGGRFLSLKSDDPKMKRGK